jgi:hypothetical protein
MHKRKVVTFTGKAFDTDKFTAGMKAYHDCNSKRYGPLIGYELISMDYDYTDTGNGWNATHTQTYRSNRVPKHLRIENAIEREKKIVGNRNKRTIVLDDTATE